MTSCLINKRVTLKEVAAVYHSHHNMKQTEKALTERMLVNTRSHMTFRTEHILLNFYNQSKVFAKQILLATIMK